MTDSVNHPSHYNQGGPRDTDGSAQFETIKIIESLGWGFAFCMGNALKYILRAPHKGSEAEDLKKAQWYLMRARGHGGSLRPAVNRKFSPMDVSGAWGLLPTPVPPTDPSEPAVGTTSPGPDVDHVLDVRLALVVNAIMVGNSYEALEKLNFYLTKFDADRG